MNINRVVITGNLTADPDLKTTPSGTSVCKLRIASNERVKDSNGEWGERPNYFTVTVWGAQGENCNRYLAKGRPVAIDGRLRWREYQTNDGGKREAIEIVANSVQFLSDGKPHEAAPAAPATGGDEYGSGSVAGGGLADDDIPY
jgi:single-strand DNA-binding protein